MLLDDGSDGAHYFPQTQIVLEVLNQLVELKGTVRRQSLKFGNVFLVPVASALLSFKLTLPLEIESKGTHGRHWGPICCHVSSSFDFPSASLLVSSSRALIRVSEGRIK